MPKAKETPLTPSKLEQFRIASNRVSLESIKYAAEIVGYTDLITATVAALEKLIETGSAQCPRESLHALSKSNQLEFPRRAVVTRHPDRAGLGLLGRVRAIPDRQLC